MDITQYTTNDEIVAIFGLPELPEPVEDTGEYAEGELAALVISRSGQEKVYLDRDGEITVADAQEYCSRDDTRDPDGDWFVMFYRR